MKYLDYDMTHLFGRAYGAGSGSAIDDMIDETGIQHNDGRSHTRTTFLAGDAQYDNPRRQEQYKRLAKINDGMYHTSRASENFKADMCRTTKTFCSQVEMNNYQRDRVLYIMDTLEVNTFGHFSTEKVILAVMTLVADENMRHLRDEELFREMCETIDVTLKEIRTIRRMVRQRHDQF